MKKKETNEEIRQMTDNQIRDRLEDLRKEKTRFEYKKIKRMLRTTTEAGPTGEYGAYKKLKKDIARCLTELNKRTIQRQTR